MRERHIQGPYTVLFDDIAERVLDRDHLDVDSEFIEQTSQLTPLFPFSEIRDLMKGCVELKTSADEAGRSSPREIMPFDHQGL